MKSKKVTMLVAALVVAVVALAGIGYATSPAYKATTTNNDNTLDSTYLVLKQSDNGSGGAYFDLFEAIYYNTMTTKAAATTEEPNPVEVTTYTPVFDYKKDSSSYQKITGEEVGTMALVSKALILNIERTNSSGTDATMKIEADNFTGITGLKYTMVLVKDPSGTAIPVVTTTADVTTPTSGKAVWSIPITLNDNTDHNATTQYAVYLFVSLADSSTPAAPAEGQSMATGGFGSTSTKSTFTFTVTVPAVTS